MIDFKFSSSCDVLNCTFAWMAWSWSYTPRNPIVVMAYPFCIAIHYFHHFNLKFSIIDLLQLSWIADRSWENIDSETH